MKINCLNGYFIFREDELGEVAKFNSLYGKDLEEKDDYFTFSFLKDAPKYSLILKPYLGVPAIITYAGQPWEVMGQNEFVYNFVTKTVVPIATITSQVQPTRAYNGYVSRGLIQPGSINTTWLRVRSYSAHLNIKTLMFEYSEIVYA